MTSRADSGQGQWQLKRVKSSTGPVGTAIAAACRTPASVPGQTEMLWIATTTSRRADKEAIMQMAKKKFDQVYDPNEDKGTNPNIRNTGSSLYGWKHDIGYKFHVTHLPNTGVIRLKLYEGSTLLHDTGDIIDNGADALRGGRLGVYCESQENILWSALSYRWVLSICRIDFKLLKLYIFRCIEG